MQGTLLIPSGGKHQGQSPVAAVAGQTSNQKSRLLYAVDRNSGRRFLVDSGAEVSVFPASPYQIQLGSQGLPLAAANGSSINTFGTRNIALRFGNRRFNWKFSIAKVTQPLLGGDFLRAYNLMPDVAGQRLVDASDFTSIDCGTAAAMAPHLNSVNAATDPYGRLLAEFPSVVQPQFSTSKVQHGVQHYIQTTGSPLHTRARRLPPDKLQIAKEEFRKMEELGIIRRSDSQWASPLHMVRKADGGWRPCGDFRRLNDATEADRYPVPNIQDFTAHLAGATIFSKIDLVKGYHQVPVHPDHVCKTAVITPFGLFEFLRMPFGLKNAAQAFQRLMDTTLRGLDFVFVYLDDILVASKSKQEHLDHLRQVLERLQTAGLTINLAKCQFGKSAIDFLGHRVDKHGATPLPTKVEAIKNFEKPTTIKGIQEFVGMINFYHKFVPNVAALLRPLFQAVSGKPKSSKNVEWTEQMSKAFNDTKTALANATMLARSPTSR